MDTKEKPSIDSEQQDLKAYEVERKQRKMIFIAAQVLRQSAIAMADAEKVVNSLDFSPLNILQKLITQK